MDGRSFLPLARGERAPWRDSLLYEYYWERNFPQTPTMHALRGARYKYIRYYGLWDSDELYDLADDPLETRNLAGDPAHREVADRLNRELFETLATTERHVYTARAGPGRDPESTPAGRRQGGGLSTERLRQRAEMRRPYALGRLAGLVLLLSPVNGNAEPARPNILWISNEDMSPHLGAYGDRLARTPALDRLATQSIRYTSAFTTAPVCAPSRAAIITGMYQNAIGAHHMRTTEDTVPELPGPYLAVPPFFVKAFPEYLRAAGYYTTNRAKTDYQFGVPFTIWDEVGAVGSLEKSSRQVAAVLLGVQSGDHHESRIFPSSQARKGKPLVTDPAR